MEVAAVAATTPVVVHPGAVAVVVRRRHYLWRRRRFQNRFYITRRSYWLDIGRRFRSGRCNYDALQSATNSEVAQAQEMAASGSTTEEIGDYLAGEVTPDAGTVSTTTSGGNVESASEATAQQIVARPGTSAPQILRSYFDDLSTAITGGAGGAAGGATSGGAQAGGTPAATADDGFDDAGFISAAE